MIYLVKYHGISHKSLVFSTHTRLTGHVYTEKLQVTCGIVHGIPLESVALPVKYIFGMSLKYMNSKYKYSYTSIVYYIHFAFKKETVPGKRGTCIGVLDARSPGSSRSSSSLSTKINQHGTWYEI